MAALCSCRFRERSSQDRLFVQTAKTGSTIPLVANCCAAARTDWVIDRLGSAQGVEVVGQTESPDLAGGQLRTCTTPTGVGQPDDLKLVAEVRCWLSGKPIGRGEATARLVLDPDPLAGRHFLVEEPMSRLESCTPKNCALYTAKSALQKTDECSAS